MTELQSKVLEILKWTDSFCREHHIRYYMVGGSMLGAIRHHGFVPWDDDIDIAVPRPDYERMRKLLKQIDHPVYYAESYQNGAKDYIYPYMKIYDKTTTVIERTANSLKRGVFLDVFPIDGTEPQHFKKVRRAVNFLSAKTCCWSKTRKLYKNLSIIAAKAIPLFGGYQKLLSRIDTLCQNYDYDSSEQAGVLTGTYGEKEIMPRSYYGTPTEYEFEGVRCFGVEQYDLYLKRLYGNYMQPPPPEKRTSPHTFLCCDLNKPYRGGTDGQ